MRRIVLVVMDSVGMGELPDATFYGDTGSNTLGNISAAVGGLRLPNLEKLGLGNIDNLKGYVKCDSPKGCFGRMTEQSKGKDTTTGHWEIAGVILDKAFPVYPSGFPKEIIHEFENRIGLKTIGNITASGTQIIDMLGKKHVETGFPIVYTSADSVFQIAAHEGVIPVERLYEICNIARNLLTGQHAVGRVIARPFTGEIGSFKRTDKRRDFSLKPLRKTVLDYAYEKGLLVKAVGKIEDIYGGQGITHAVHTHDNMDGVNRTLQYMSEDFEGIIFTNLVDFDMVYGHRNDAEGYAKALVEFDGRIPEILGQLKEEDILIITADHGCDPTTPSTDHSREYVPLLVYGNGARSNVNLGTRNTFSDIAATISEYLELKADIPGISFLPDILRRG
ncbi:MAG TPA: phosphopentomutase [Pseudobacteroides sp.]|uniref:phosphopentomutase n=1 Tax=Pseudobacteroides sp. TaxID=1968840 RepID=UPI002F95E1C9